MLQQRRGGGNWQFPDRRRGDLWHLHCVPVGSEPGSQPGAGRRYGSLPAARLGQRADHRQVGVGEDVAAVGGCSGRAPRANNTLPWGSLLAKPSCARSSLCFPRPPTHPRSASGISTIRYSQGQCNVQSAFLLSSPCQQTNGITLQVPTPTWTQGLSAFGSFSCALGKCSRLPACAATCPIVLSRCCAASPATCRHACSCSNARAGWPATSSHMPPCPPLPLAACHLAACPLVAVLQALASWPSPKRSRSSLPSNSPPLANCWPPSPCPPLSPRRLPPPRRALRPPPLPRLPPLLPLPLWPLKEGQLLRPLQLSSRSPNPMLSASRQGAAAIGSRHGCRDCRMHIPSSRGCCQPSVAAVAPVPSVAGSHRLPVPGGQLHTPAADCPERRNRAE